MFTKNLNFTKICDICKTEFKSADVKAKWCKECKKPKLCLCGCGNIVKTVGRFYKASHHPNSHTKEAHAKQAKAISGENNPAKQDYVRAKISKAVTENHPSKTHIEQWKAHGKFLSTNTTKVSKLEDRLAPIIGESWIRQYRVGKFCIDFANVELQKAIEVYGCWYHCCPKHHPIALCARQEVSSANDIKRMKNLKALGWQFEVIWECELERWINDYLGQGALLLADSSVISNPFFLLFP